MPPKRTPHPASPLRWIVIVLLVVTINPLSFGLLFDSTKAQTSRASPVPNISAQTASEVEREGYVFRSPGVATNRWPAVRIDFSIERGDKTMFRELDMKDIESLLNGQTLARSESSLKRNNGPMRILFMIDRSGSMVVGAEPGESKLDAAKEALKYVVGQMETNDEVTIFSFDSEQLLNFSPTNRRESLNSAIDSINPKINPRTRNFDPYTNLYDAVEKAINEASNRKITEVIVLSDGWEDTEETKWISEAAFREFKREREQEISRLSRQKAIRVSTLAIGAREGDRKTSGSVDYDTLCGISNATNGGKCRHIDLPKLRRLAGSDAEFKNLIALDMKQTLEELRQSFRYGYSLTLNFPANMPREDGELALNFALNDGKLKLPVVFPFTWENGSSAPIFKPPRTSGLIWLDVRAATVDPGSLLQIYLLLLLPIGLLSLVPTAYNRYELRKEIKQMDKAIVHLNPSSELVGRQCPNEMGEWGKRFAFKTDDVVIVCPGCQTPHHLSCWDFNQHQCMNRLCEKPIKVPSRIMSKYGINEETKGSPA